MKIACISDTHGFHDHVRIPSSDVLIHCGDFTKDDQGRKPFREFLQWFERQPASKKILISGNHDSQTQRFPDLAKQMMEEYAPSVTYLRDSGVIINGWKLHGSPYTPTFYNWFNMRDRGPAIKRHWDLIPNDTDILITHGPAKGFLDWSDFGKEHCGCQDLYEAVLRVKPRYHAFGHCHLQWGSKDLVHDDGRKTTFINAAICDEGYRPTRQPWIINLP